MSAAVTSRQPIYYGWWVLCAGAITEMLAVGSTSYAAGLFVLPLERELSLSRAAASSAVPISYAGAAAMAPLVGYLLDRLRAQLVITIGAVSLGLGFVLISVTSSISVMVLTLLTLVALGGMAMGPLSTSTLASRWFYRTRGRALGIAAAATSGGGIIVVPLLSLAIESYGWRTALAIEAMLVVLIVILLATFVIRNGPDQRELNAYRENAGRPIDDGGEGSHLRRQIPPAVNWRYGAIFSSRNFWATALVLAVVTGISQALLVTLVPYGAGLGFAPAATAFLISAFSVSAAFMKVASGLVADFIDRRAILLAATFLMIAALAVLLSFSSYGALVLVCCLAGTALGCVIPSAAAVVAACFGSPSFGRVMGAIYAAVVASSILSVGFAGAVFDRAGNYRAAFLTFLALAAVAAIAAPLIRERKYEQE